MSDSKAAVEKYVAAWNEPDAGARRKVIGEIWAADGVYSNAGTEFHGLEGIEDAVTEAHEAFVKKGYVFKVAKVDTNHDAVRYIWEMVPGEGGEPASIGTHVARVGPGGRWIREHQFIDKLPPGA